jgi:hypothetical protein
MDLRERMGHGLLLAAVGSRLADVARVHYEHAGRVDTATGPLELGFEGGRTLVLITGAHGEWLRVDPQKWEDAFPEPLADEDRAYVEAHGKLSRFDARGWPGYAEAVGRPLTGIRWLAREWGAVGGAELAFGPAALTCVSWGDEEYVFPGPAAAVPVEWGFHVLPADDHPSPAPAP